MLPHTSHKSSGIWLGCEKESWNWKQKKGSQMPRLCCVSSTIVWEGCLEKRSNQRYQGQWRWVRLINGLAERRFSFCYIFTPVSVEPESPSRSISADIPTAVLGRDALLSQPSFAPYTDDPELGSEPPEPATMLQTQRLLMDGGLPCFRLINQLGNKQVA